MRVTTNDPDRLVFEDSHGVCYASFTREGSAVVVASFLAPELTPENQKTLAEWLAGGVK